MTSTPPTPGPKLLEERSLGGILIHFLAIPTGVVGAGLLYLLAADEFTKRNARNALDGTLLCYDNRRHVRLCVTYAELADRCRDVHSIGRFGWAVLRHFSCFGLLSRLGHSLSGSSQW